jgi:probable HAF family extracellular repeat protein
MQHTRRHHLPKLLTLAACALVTACDATDTTPALTGPRPGVASADVAVPPPIVSTGYTLTDISAGLESSASDINDGGTVVGRHTVGGSAHGFVRHADGTIEDLPPLPGDVSNVATGINNANQIVGTSTASSGKTHAWRRLPGHAMERLTDGDCAGAAHANAIDDAGEIVGGCDFTQAEWHVDSPDLWHVTAGGGDLYDVAAHTMVGMLLGPVTDFSALMWDANGPAVLTMPPGTVQSKVNGINGSRLMVGDYAVGGYPSPTSGFTIVARGGFYGTRGAIHTLPHAAYGISGKGRIVGWYVSIPAVAYTIAPNGFVVETALPPANRDRAAVRVNKCGTIVGHYFPAGLQAGARAAMWTKPVCD